MVEHVEYGRGCGFDLTGYAVEHLTAAGERNLDFFNIGGKEGEGCEGCRAYGKSLSGCGGGVAEGVEDVGAFADLRVEFGHLGISAGVVGYWTVSVCGKGDSEGAEHSDCSNCDSVKALGEGCGFHHRVDVKSYGEEEGEYDCKCDCKHRDSCGEHSEADAADDDCCRAGLGRFCELLGRLVGV